MEAAVMDKVFYSGVTRSHIEQNNDLYELLKVVPAKPISVAPKKTTTCDFQPRNDKHYLPKKKSKIKVKTVRDIRSVFEKETYDDLPSEIEKQQNMLLRKIKIGSSREDRTKSLAKNILNCDKPISRASWQMLMNINPDGHTHSTQYVLWNGKLIRVNGSKGGRNKFLFNHDLGKDKEPLKINKTIYKKNDLKKRGLLRNSLSVNFKPGPLTKKKFLDKSYHKYNLGDIEIVNLPKPGLEIQPSYGSAVDSTVLNILSNFREENGVISEKWANFSVSVLGSVKNSVINQTDNGSSVTFDLNYQCNQHRIIMRKNLRTDCESIRNKEESEHPSPLDENNIIPEVRNVLSNILDSIEISLNQNNMFTADDEARSGFDGDSSQIQPNNHVKDKIKRKYCELDRLAVTVITVSENTLSNDLSGCRNAYCNLGCICSSLKCDLRLKSHCGRIECMFECKCGYLKRKTIDSFESDCPDYLPEILNLDNEINNTLAKEEQKFHQTVVVTGDKSILLKSKKRNWISSKKYADFYSNMRLKSELNLKPVLTILNKKINCDNIEPWCMVHNLYKCFCKGKFIEADTKTLNDKEIILDEVITADGSIEDRGSHKENNLAKRLEHDVNNLNYDINNENYENTHRTRRKQQYIEKEKDGIPYVKILDKSNPDYYNICARIEPFKGRKYSKKYYLNTSCKIQNMEINDDSLRKRLSYLLHNSLKSQKGDGSSDTSIENDHLVNSDKNNIEKDIIIEDQSNAILKENDNTIKEKHKELTKSNLQDKQLTSLEDHQLPNLQKDQPPNLLQEQPPNAQHERPSPLFSESQMSYLEMIETSTENRISNRPKLVAWLESSYQLYKKRVDMGINRNALEPPRKGKVALYPWNFILKRYSERKNLFLVTKQKPFRIFMAVDNKSPFFGNCINIDEIRFADLYKYPITVKNLLTNMSGLNDYFCILLGLNECWELIGSVTKVSDKKDNDNEDDVSEPISVQENQNNLSGLLRSGCSSISEDNESIKDQSHSIIEEIPASSESSKWFVMTVENDFSEIQFYNRGFFVKYDSIMTAINVARMSSKTVRLSSQKCAEKNSGPQFGIYAIPNANECCVFVGPYETNEQLGIETVKTIANSRKMKRTRGVWIKTDKVDNLKVIDNPLSFMPSKSVDYSEMLPIENDHIESSEPHNDTEVIEKESKEPSDKTEIKEPLKNVKPIKIKKTDGFYHLSSTKIVKTLSAINHPQIATSQQSTSFKQNLWPISTDISIVTLPNNIENTSLIKPEFQSKSLLNSSILLSTSSEISDQNKIKKKPVAEVAPQIKIAAVYSESPVCKQPESNKKTEGGMFILKPEEINQRLVENKIFPSVDLNRSHSSSESNDVQDLEDFLDKSTIISPDSVTETFVISDDEDEPPPNKEVWLECQNIKNLGLIRGQMSKDGLISFQFPGFKFTDFYEKDVAFTKINQVLSRKVYIPKNLTLEWDVVESVEANKPIRMFSKEDFGPDRILTSQGIRHKKGLLIYSKSDIKTYRRKRSASLKSHSTKDEKKVITKQGLRKIMRYPNSEVKTYSRGQPSTSKSAKLKKRERQGMDPDTFNKKSKTLEDEGSVLWNKTIIRQDEIANLLAEASDEDRKQFSDTLKDILNQTLE